jgi:hypothetical protein
MTQDSALIIRIKVEQEGNMIYVSSQDLHGLHICGPTVEQTYQSLVKAVIALFKYNRKMDVEVIPATTDGKSFPQIIGLCEQLVVQRLAA